MTKIYLNAESLNGSGGKYGLVSAFPNPGYTDVYVNLQELINAMQEKVNAEANALAELTDSAQDVQPTISTPWRIMFGLLNELKAL